VPGRRRPGPYVSARAAKKYFIRVPDFVARPRVIQWSRSGSVMQTTSELKRRKKMITQLTIMLALIVALAAGSSAPVTSTNSASKGINPVQHSE
jgi:hypothetical protein